MSTENPKFPPVDIGLVDRHDAHTMMASPMTMAMVHSGVQAALAPRLLIKLGLMKPEEYQAFREEVMLTVAAIVAKHVIHTPPDVAENISQEHLNDLMGQDVAAYIEGGIDPDDLAQLCPDLSEVEGSLN